MNKGFTLVELSIVIVIIGLLAGGVLGASSLINSAKRAGTIEDLKDYDNAVNAFYLEYDALPGDFDEASSYFPSMPDICGYPDGDGDGMIEDSLSSYAETVENQYCEEAVLWDHLIEAGIYKSKGTMGYYYSGAGNTINAPGGRYSGSFYLIGYEEFGSNTGNYTRLASVDDENTFGSALSPQDMRAIDRKIDNDNPTTGNIIAQDGTDVSSGDCYTGTSYVVTGDQVSCVLLKKLTYQ